jgi:hypothetical protein
MSNLKDASLRELEIELTKRRDAAKKEKAASDRKRVLDDWRCRGRDAILGKAYGPDNGLSQVSLAKVVVAGNMSHTYDVSVKVIRPVEIYFHNAWSRTDESAFQKKLSDLVDKEVNAQINNPVVVAKLIMLSRPRDPEIEAEWRQAAVSRMCEFDAKAIKKAVLHFQTQSSHNELELLKEVAERQKNCPTCVDRFTCFTTRNGT